MKAERGVALVLVLAVTGVLALLCVQISLTSKEQVMQAQRLVDRAEADLRLRSIESDLLFSLLTSNQDANQTGTRRKDPYAAAWNFRGETFEVNGASIRIQDMAGLFPIVYPNVSSHEFVALMAAVGIDRSRAEMIARWVSSFVSETSLPLQSFSELAAISDLSVTEIDRLQEVATLFPTVIFNPSTAPEAVLAAKYEGVAEAGIISARRQGELNWSRVREITGTDPDDTMVTFVPGLGFRIDISVEVRAAHLRRESIWTVRPASASSPLELWGYRSLDR